MVAELVWQLIGSRTLRNVAPRVELAATSVLVALQLRRARARQRRALARLDDHRFHDTGCPCGDGAREYARPVWRA